jgi:hypothetical protein
MIAGERAWEQPTDNYHNNNKKNQTEHCFSPFAGDPALILSWIKKRGFYHDTGRIKVSPVMLSRVIFLLPYWRRGLHFLWSATPFLHLL